MSRRISEIRAGVPPPATPTPRKIIPPPISKSGTPHASVFTPKAYEELKQAMERGELETPSRVPAPSPNDKRPFVIPMQPLEEAEEESELAKEQEQVTKEETEGEGQEEKAV